MQITRSCVLLDGNRCPAKGTPVRNGWDENEYSYEQTFTHSLTDGVEGER